MDTGSRTLMVEHWFGFVVRFCATNDTRDMCPRFDAVEKESLVNESPGEKQRYNLERV